MPEPEIWDGELFWNETRPNELLSSPTGWRKDGSKNLEIEKDPEPSLLLLSRSKTELPPTEESVSLCLTCETKRWESLTVELTSETEDEAPPLRITDGTHESVVTFSHWLRKWVSLPPTGIEGNGTENCSSLSGGVGNKRGGNFLFTIPCLLGSFFLVRKIGLGSRRGSWWVNFPLLGKRVGRTRKMISYHRTFAICYLKVNFDRLWKFLHLLLNLPNTGLAITSVCYVRLGSFYWVKLLCSCNHTVIQMVFYYLHNNLFDEKTILLQCLGLCLTFLKWYMVWMDISLEIVLRINI